MNPVDAVTQVLREHQWMSFDMSRDVCTGCDWRGKGRDHHNAHVAAVVVESLGLTPDALNGLYLAQKAFVDLTEAWAELRMDTEKDQALHDRLVGLSRNAASLLPPRTAWSPDE